MISHSLNFRLGRPLRPQSIGDYSQFPEAFVERALRVCKSHECRVAEVSIDLHKPRSKNWKKQLFCLEDHLGTEQKRKLRHGPFHRRCHFQIVTLGLISAVFWRKMCILKRDMCFGKTGNSGKCFPVECNDVEKTFGIPRKKIGKKLEKIWKKFGKKIWIFFILFWVLKENCFERRFLNFFYQIRKLSIAGVWIKLWVHGFGSDFSCGF